MSLRLTNMHNNNNESARCRHFFGQGLRRMLLVGATLASSPALTGCTSLTQPIDGIPARRLPPQFYQETKNELVPIDVSLLAQEQPRQYILGAGDILGITVDRILPYAEPETVPEPPPVHFPSEKSDLNPATGFPITILEDGNISLPLVKPIKVAGLTEDQARDLIRKTYLDARILKEDDSKKISVIVTVIKKRQINVVVIRQDQAPTGAGGQNTGAGQAASQTDYSASGRVLRLDAYKNDILNALVETGGLPGVAARNEIKVLRSSRSDQLARMAFIQQYAAIVANHLDPCSCPPPMPEDPTVLRIPLRLPKGVLPSVRPQDVILEEGDIVLIESRDTEFFYTGGLLQGGRYPIPRDFDLDVLGALSMAGQGISSQGAGGGGGGILGGARGIGGVPPGRVYILRKTPCKGQLAIEVDLARAINNPRERPIIQPGDTLILQYKPFEEVLNFGLGTFFTYGIQQVLQNRN
jgi:protein involved in polysaccharide export with SLBB domain